MGVFWLCIGVVMTFRAEFVLSGTAKLNRRFYGEDGAFHRFFDRTPFGWFQQVMMGHCSAEFQRRAATSPKEFVAALIFARVLGVLALGGGVMLTIGGIVELVG